MLMEERFLILRTTGRNERIFLQSIAAIFLGAGQRGEIYTDYAASLGK